MSPPDNREDTDPERVLATIGKEVNWKYDFYYLLLMDKKPKLCVEYHKFLVCVCVCKD